MTRTTLLRDPDPDCLRDPDYLAGQLATPAAEWVVVRRPPSDEVETGLAAAGFRKVAVPGAPDYLIGRRQQNR